MKKFMAVYLASGSGNASKEWNSLDEKARKEREQAGMSGWQQWALRNGKQVLDHGGPLGKTKRIDPHGISDVRNEMTAYTIIEAESHDEAAKLFLNHPHFASFPGDAVEVMECLPLPTM